MISLDEINKTILDLENHDTTYATCEKLAWLYIVKDHITNATKSSSHDNIQSFPEVNGEALSEFLIISSTVNINDLLNVLNEHMEVVKVLIPKEYSALIEKMKGLAKS